MPKFTTLIRRDVAYHDFVERTVEAVSEDAARAQFEAMASSFDRECPDDAEEGDGIEFGGWYIGGDIEPADDDAEVDDV